MSNKIILLDSNAYFRLADNFYPLLSEKFGKQAIYDLRILGGTLGEYNYQARLQSKFSWVDNEKHKEDRKGNKLRIVKKNIRKSIQDNQAFILQQSLADGYSCSRFDIECLSTAIELQCPLATDDEDLFTLCEEYEVEVKSTISLLK